MDASKFYFERLKVLEESLWWPATRFDQRHMDFVLAPDYREFGRDGRTYSRQEVLDVPPEQIDVAWPLRDFQVQLLSQDVALVTYLSEVTYETVEVTYRTSIWLRTDAGWRLRFHQGTPAIAGA